MPSAAVAIHDLNLAARFCDTIVMMPDGKLSATDNASSVLTTENIRVVYWVEVDSKNNPYIIPLTPVN